MPKRRALTQLLPRWAPSAKPTAPDAFTRQTVGVPLIPRGASSEKPTARDAFRRQTIGVPLIPRGASSEKWTAPRRQCLVRPRELGGDRGRCYPPAHA
jgi:hypothetical protein